MNRALICDCLAKTYLNGTEALKNVSLELFFGQFVGLIGANGAGKSTLIHLLSGVLQPTAGLTKRYIGSPEEITWVSQFTSIDWYLSVFDNVRLGARLGNYGFKEASVVAQKALEQVRLCEKGSFTPDALSGGEQKRLQIARSLAQNARILILDEPTTGLDPVASRTLMQELREYARLGSLVIVSCHDMDLLEEFSDHILLLKEGEMLLNGNKKDLLAERKLKNVYMDYCA